MVSIQELHKRSNSGDEIVSGIFLGNEEASQDPNFIKRNRITAIINCTPSVPNKFSKNGIQYIRLPVDDSLKVGDINKMTAFMPYIVETLRELILKKHRVLVHCHAGMQRSAAVVSAYLMQYHGMTPMQSIRFIISKRPIAFYNGKSINFEKSLTTFHKHRSKFKASKIKDKKPTYNF